MKLNRMKEMFLKNLERIHFKHQCFLKSMVKNSPKTNFFVCYKTTYQALATMRDVRVLRPVETFDLREMSCLKSLR